MTTLLVRSLAQRKLRSVLTAVAVLLGVAMIAGTYVQTDRIHAAFGDIASTGATGIDAVVTAHDAFNSGLGPSQTFGEDVLTRVRAVPQVAAAQGQLYEMGSLVVGGKAVGSNFAPSLVLSWRGERFSPLQFVAGGPPRRKGDVVLNTRLAQDQHLRIGQVVGLSTRTGVKRVRVAGIADYGDATSLGGATLVVPRLADMRRWFDRRGRLTTVVAAARPGVTPERLAAAVQAVLPQGLDVRTGAQDAAKATKEANDALAFLSPALLAFAGAALLVGAFIIFNTFSITVAQRTREFALLRSLGATRRQILAAVALEALVIGSAASALGLLAGLGFAAALGALFDAAGFGIPASGVHLAARTIVVSLGVGIGVTLLAALVPAMRATRIPPVAALQSAAAPRATSRRGPAVPLVTAAVTLLGLASLLQGLFGSGPAATRLGGLAGGAVLLFVGLALASRWFVRPLAGAIGWPLQRALDEPGRLARENAMRNPARTAGTAAALMVGLGLVVFVAVFAAGLKVSIGGSLGELVHADALVTGKGAQTVPAGAQTAILRSEGVAVSVPVYFDRIQVNGRKANATTDTIDGADLGTLARVYAPKWTHGGSDALLWRLARDDALVEEQFARTHGLAIGDRFRVQTASGRRTTLTAIGEFRDPQILQGVVVPKTTFLRVSSIRDPFIYFVAASSGADRPRMLASLKASLRQFPAATARSDTEYLDYVNASVNQTVYLLYALLAMSLVISLFGIANSLFLSIHERIREFGLLRAIGATQRQIRRIVRYESMITATIGGVLGTAIGIVFAALTTAALSNLGLVFALPVGQLAVFLVLAVLVGIAGAVVPARRAAAVHVLDAVHQD